jgi:V/A-type H+/Na+-transporting ATPase subunit D
MNVRHPPGRAGRPWLAHRLAVARRGAELLDSKHRALMSERHRLEPLVAEARTVWEAAAREAERALARAAVLGGERQVDLARRSTADHPAEVTVRWRAVLGVSCPADADVAPRALPELSAVGGSAALMTAAGAHRRALDAAVQLAALAGALERVDQELRATSLRRNAVERRWIPAHETALADLELALEELEREDGTRVRWASLHASES